MPSDPKRPYRQTVRAAAAEDLRRRVMQAFYGLMLERWLDDVTLDDVAAIAGTTRRTVIRMFGGKDGLLAAVLEFLLHAGAIPRMEMPADAPLSVSIAGVVDHYEQSGDFVLRLLAQEERQPLLHPQIERGRRMHRAWVAERFLGGFEGDAKARETLVTELVVATDVYTWKLLRRDRGHAPDEVAEIMKAMIVALTGRRIA